MANWIAGAIKRPGALRKKAAAAGKINKAGKIDKGFIAKEAKSKNPTTHKQANLAKTLSKLRRK